MEEMHVFDLRDRVYGYNRSLWEVALGRVRLAVEHRWPGVFKGRDDLAYPKKWSYHVVVEPLEGWSPNQASAILEFSRRPGGFDHPLAGFVSADLGEVLIFAPRGLALHDEQMEAVLGQGGDEPHAVLAAAIVKGIESVMPKGASED